jgi:ABC-type phosphate transport system auxiliary subunit
MTRSPRAIFKFDGTHYEVPSMPISAVLSRTLHEALGDEAAAELVDWMQQVDKHRSGLREFYELGFARIDSRFGEHRHERRAETSALRMEMHDEFAAVRGEMNHEFAAVRSEMHAGFADVRTEMRAGFADVKISLAESKAAISAVESNIDRRYAELLKWSFLFWSGSFAAMALARWPR